MFTFLNLDIINSNWPVIPRYGAMKEKNEMFAQGCFFKPGGNIYLYLLQRSFMFIFPNLMCCQGSTIMACIIIFDMLFAFL